ncbi:MAG: ribonuclease T, partial [Marinomonas sp.]
KACEVASIPFSNSEAHSAKYDTEKTAELFCEMVNRWKQLGGWPLIANETEEDDMASIFHSGQ